jgi:hypothetical protein
MNYLGVKAVSDTAKDERSIEIAKEMKKEGFDSQMIKRLTKLSDEEIAKL